ncbi:hypothetical protein TNCV_4188721 [Trichonephila clavipes]|nr:hypothetical protein TNCV_4188721 [Trichonephila clavipes]
MIERNRARKIWQFTRDPSDKRLLNNIQDRIHRKVKAFQNKTWEDELRAFDPDDGSLWEMSKELRKKKSPVYAINGQGGIAHTDSDKAEVYKELEAVCLRLAVVWGETMSQAPVGSPSEEGWNRRHKSAALGGWDRERPANRFSFPSPSEKMEWPQKRSNLKIVV